MITAMNQPPAILDLDALTACVDHYSVTPHSDLVAVFTPEDPDFYDFTVPEYLYDRLTLEDEWGVALQIPLSVSASFTHESIVLRNQLPNGASIEVPVNLGAPALEEASRVATEMVNGVNQVLIPARSL